MAAVETTRPPEAKVEEFSELRDELAQYVGTLKLERKTKKEIAHLMDEVQSAMSKRLVLETRPLRRWFPGVDSAVLLEGERLILRKGKREYEVSVLTLQPDPYMAVVKEAASIVVRLLSEAEARAAALAKPALQVSTRMIGGKLAVFDWRNYVLVLANTGGQAKRVTISESTASQEKYGPFDIDSLETNEIGLRHFYRILNSKVLKVRARCEDQDGRRYTGEVELGPNTKAIRVFKLVPSEQGPG